MRNDFEMRFCKHKYLYNASAVKHCKIMALYFIRNLLQSGLCSWRQNVRVSRYANKLSIFLWVFFSVKVMILCFADIARIDLEPSFLSSAYITVTLYNRNFSPDVYIQCSASIMDL